MQQKNVPELSFGISSWSYPWAAGVAQGPQPDKPLTALGLLEKAQALDVKRVQFADNLPLEKLSETDLQALVTFADAQGICMEAGTKGIEPEHMKRFLDIAQALNSPVLRTLPAIFGQRVPIEDVEQSLRQVLPAYEQAGIVIVLENQEAYTVVEYAGLMQRVDNPHLRICLDLSNALGAMEGPGYVMEQLGPYCGSLHFKTCRSCVRQPSWVFP
ncbi:sugar phosphate isomerase/epimerase family protein [Planctomycetota bacterium]